MAYTVGSLFSGIGGFELGFERAGFDVRWQVEIDPFCRAVLAKHWPEVARYDDVRTCGAANLEPVDVVCGGFPCQPVSLAGRRKAQADDRWLWPEFARVLRELRPRIAALENVPGLLVHGLEDVLGDLAAIGYDAEWDCVSAADVGANHRRERVWILAYANVAGLEGRHGGELRERAGEQPARTCGALADANGEGQLQQGGFVGEEWRRAGDGRGWWRTEPDVGRVAHGIPARMDRLRALGNAIVPQVAEVIARRVRALLEV